jgi:hypothetical protein
MTELTLRPYQEHAVNAILNALDSSKKRILISMPIGAGRNLILAKAIANYSRSKKRHTNNKFLIISNRVELLLQFKETLNKLGEDEISEALSSGDSHFQTVTLQRLLSQAEFFNRKTVEKFSTLIFLSDDIWNYENNTVSQIFEFYSNSIVIGISSGVKPTPYFGEPVFRYSFSEAIKDGVLLPVKFVKFTNFKFDDKDVSSLERVTSLAKRITEYTNGEKCIVFCKDQQESFDLSNEINTILKDSSYSKSILGTSDDYSNIIKNFLSSSNLKVLTNVEILRRGIILPNLKFIALTKPIRSAEALIQTISIGMAPFKNKTELTVLDFSSTDITKLIPSEFNDFLLIEENNERNPKENFGQINRFNDTEILLRDRNSVEGVIGVKEIAAELSSLISQMPYEQGRMIGIFGKWGRGKTFAMNETWKVLNASNQFERIDFHAWLYQDTQAAWAYLYEQFSNSYYKGTGVQSWFRKVVRRLYLNIVRLGWFEVGQLILSFSISISSLFLFDLHQKLEVAKQIIYTIGTGVVINLLIIYFSYRDSAKDLFKKYYKKTSFSNILGVQAEVNKELKDLISAWSKWLKEKKLILFVDDIDRCSEEKIIQIIDALRVMLEDEGVGSKLVVVAAIDERILIRSIKHKYHNLIMFDDDKNAENKKLTELTREYIDKLFILSIKLGDLEENEKAEYFDELTKHDRVIEVNKTDTTKQDSRIDVSDIEVPMQNVADEKNTESFNTNNQENDESNEEASNKLTLEELGLLRQSLKTFSGATPRQIRIYYFRYLLSKRMLISRYFKLGRENLWMSQLYGPILMQLLIQYGWFYDASLIKEHITIISKEPKSEVEILLAPGRFLPKNDYLELLRVLEVTSAY